MKIVPIQHFECSNPFTRFDAIVTLHKKIITIFSHDAVFSNMIVEIIHFHYIRKRCVPLKKEIISRLVTVIFDG